MIIAFLSAQEMQWPSGEAGQLHFIAMVIIIVILIILVDRLVPRAINPGASRTIVVLPLLRARPFDAHYRPPAAEQRRECGQTCTDNSNKRLNAGPYKHGGNGPGRVVRIGVLIQKYDTNNTGDADTRNVRSANAHSLIR